MTFFHDPTIGAKFPEEFSNEKEIYKYENEILRQYSNNISIWDKIIQDRCKMEWFYCLFFNFHETKMEIDFKNLVASFVKNFISEVIINEYRNLCSYTKTDFWYDTTSVGGTMQEETENNKEIFGDESTVYNVFHYKPTYGGGGGGEHKNNRKNDDETRRKQEDDLSNLFFKLKDRLEEDDEHDNDDDEVPSTMTNNSWNQEGVLGMEGGFEPRQKKKLIENEINIQRYIMSTYDILCRVFLDENEKIRQKSFEYRNRLKENKKAGKDPKSEMLFGEVVYSYQIFLVLCLMASFPDVEKTIDSLTEKDLAQDFVTQEDKEKIQKRITSLKKFCKKNVQTLLQRPFDQHNSAYIIFDFITGAMLAYEQIVFTVND